MGWNLSLPSITRKTDKGIPKYEDADESDVFTLSGAEDLVPVRVEQGEGQTRTVANNIYNIKSYRPRIEGLFARIERWTNAADPGETSSGVPSPKTILRPGMVIQSQKQKEWSLASVR